jgi:hypothetical protein
MPYLDAFGTNTDIDFEDLFDLFDNITIGYDGDLISVLDNGITTSKIAGNSVTDPKIVSVSASKITGSFPSISVTDLKVSVLELISGTVTYCKQSIGSFFNGASSTDTCIGTVSTSNKLYLGVGFNTAVDPNIEIGNGYTLVRGDLKLPSNTPSSVAYFNSTSTLKSVTLGNGQIMIGSTGNDPVSANITSSDGSITVTNGAGSIDLSVADHSDTFHTITLDAPSNQLIFKPNAITPTITVNATNPSSNRIYNIPDVGVDSDLVMTAGNQTINGVKSFTQPVTMTNNAGVGVPASMMMMKPNAGSTAFTVKCLPPSGNRTYTVKDVGGDAGFLMDSSTGAVNQTLNVPTNGFFFIKGDQSGALPGQIEIVGNTSTDYWMTIGVDTTHNKSIIQSGTTLNTPLQLNPLGNNIRMGSGTSLVGINCDPSLGALDVLGDAYFRTDVQVVGNFDGQNITLSEDLSSPFVQFYIQGKTDNLKRISFGLDTTSNYYILDSDRSGTGYPLYLNESGGVVNIGRANGATVPNQALAIQALGTLNDLIACYDSSATLRWHMTMVNNDFNFAESSVADGRLYLKKGGHVGINTTSPSTSYALDVNGAIHSTSVGSIKNSVCMIRRDTTQAITANVTTQIGFTVGAGGIVEIDTDNMADLTNSRIVIQRAGIYRLTGWGNYVANAQGNRAIHVLRNGAVVAESTCIGTAGYQNTFQTVGLSVCSAGDAITLATTHSSATSPLNASSAGPSQFTCKLSAEWISA